VCHSATVRYVTLILGIAWAASGQGAGWRRVGSSAVELMLASPATGQVDRVWFSPDDTRLYARTHSGKVFETSDFEIWTPSTAPAENAEPLVPAVARIPEPGSRVVPASFGRVFALGRQLFRSDDGGRTWNNLTAFKDESVIGPGQTSVAASTMECSQASLPLRLPCCRPHGSRPEWRRKREAGVSTVIFPLVLTRIHAGATTWRAT